MSRLKIVNIAPALPPTLDGIGDYSARLCAQLAEFADTTILAPTGPVPDAIFGVAIEQVFDAHRRRSVAGIGDAIRRLAPDWALLQFNQFSYGQVKVTSKQLTITPKDISGTPQTDNGHSCQVTLNYVQ